MAATCCKEKHLYCMYIEGRRTKCSHRSKWRLECRLERIERLARALGDVDSAVMAQGALGTVRGERPYRRSMAIHAARASLSGRGRPAMNWNLRANLALDLYRSAWCSNMPFNLLHPAIYCKRTVSSVLGGMRRFHFGRQRTVFGDYSLPRWLGCRRREAM